MGRNKNVEKNEIYNPKKKRRKNILKPNQIEKRERERKKKEIKFIKKKIESRSKINFKR